MYLCSVNQDFVGAYEVIALNPIQAAIVFAEQYDQNTKKREDRVVYVRDDFYTYSFFIQTEVKLVYTAKSLYTK